MTYQEFLNKLQKRGSKPYKIAHCLGARDAWKWVRRNKWKSLKGIPCDKCQYGAIIDTVNKHLVELLFEGHEVQLPHKMGSFLLCSLPTKVAFEEDEIKTNYRIDWEKTLKLWYEDEEARNSHKPIRWVNRDIYFIRYYKASAHYINKYFYKCRINRSLSKKLGKTLKKQALLSEKKIFL